MIRWRVAVLAASAAGALACTACSSDSPGQVPLSSGTGTSPTSSAPSTPTLGITSSGGVVTATNAANGKSLALRVGDRLKVTLNSTYWKFGPAPGHVVNHAAGPQVAPDPSCVPGGGCGTVTESFVAVGVGTAHITASRTSCGEAMACTPAQAAFSVTVIVSQ